MPIYDYECAACGAKIEVVQPVKGVAPICTGTKKRPHNPKSMERLFPGHAKTAGKWTVERTQQKEGS